MDSFLMVDLVGIVLEIVFIVVVIKAVKNKKSTSESAENNQISQQLCENSGESYDTDNVKLPQQSRKILRKSKQYSHFPVKQ